MNPTTDSDSQLAARAAAGDRHALEALCTRVWPDVRKLCLIQLGEPAPAEDAAQESLIDLVRNVHRYDPGRPFGPWLRTLVRNRCRSSTRRTRAEPMATPPEEGVQHDPSHKLDLDRAAATALEAFGALSPRQREVIELCDRHGLAPADAAEELQIARGTARALLHQARKALRARLLTHRPELLDLVRDR